MKHSRFALLLSLLLIIAPLHAGKYYALCEGNFGQANASLWSIDESLQTLDGPLIWNASSNPLGDVAQSLTLYDHTLYIVMNGSHEVRIIDLEAGESHTADIEIPDSSPRYLAIHAESNRGYISSWNLGALLVMDLDNHAIVDTFFVGGLPEQMLLAGDEMFVSVPMESDWSASNKVLRIDLSGSSPEVTQAYDVIHGPGAMALSGDDLYVTSIYYNDAWETFSGTSRIDLNDHSVLTRDHGSYSNYTADLNVIASGVYRTHGNSIVPLNEDLSFNSAGAIGDIADMYSHSFANDLMLVGSSDFIAPDVVTIFSISGQIHHTYNVGALPRQIVYYAPELVATETQPQVPGSLTMGRNYPNPFNPMTSIPFNLAVAGEVSLQIFDLKGRLVSTLTHGYRPAGAHVSTWDGTNAAGMAVSSGIYHAILTSNSQTNSIKLNLLK